MNRPPLSGRLADWRNRLLRQPQFIQWVQRVPLLRSLGRRQAASLFNLVTGFVNSQVLLACIELDLFERLAAGPVVERELAETLAIEPSRLRVLMQAAAALELIESRRGGRWALGPLGANLLADPAIGSLVRHHRALYRDLEDPVALLQGKAGATELGRLWPYAGAADPARIPRDAVAPYTDLMGASQHMVSEQVLEAFDFSAFDSFLDVGGGDGSFVAAVSGRYPQLRAALFDLPSVIAVARERLDERGLKGRTRFYPGDFHRDALPGGQSLISLVRILHDHDDEPAARLLASARAALKSGGTLLVAEPLRDTPGAEAMGGAYFGLYLLAMGSGRPRSFGEMRKLLADSGFDRIRSHRTGLPLVCSVITARA